jgi:hypothetical protein
VNERPNTALVQFMLLKINFGMTYIPELVLLAKHN